VTDGVAEAVRLLAAVREVVMADDAVGLLDDVEEVDLVRVIVRDRVCEFAGITAKQHINANMRDIGRD
jgi:hypothetical protein